MAGENVVMNSPEQGRSIRVAYVCPTLDFSQSWGKWTLELLEGLVRMGVEPVIVTAEGARKYYEQQRLGYEVHYIYPDRYFRYFMSRRGPFEALGLFGFLSKCRGLDKIDLVHSVEAYPWCFFGFLLSRQKGVPHIYSIHGDYGWIAYRRLPDRWLYALVQRQASKIFSVSSAVQRQVLDRRPAGADISKFAVALNSIDLEYYRGLAGRLTILKKPELSTVLTVARITPVKGIEVAVQAFKLVKERMPEARHVIVGGGVGCAYYGELVQIIEEQGIGDVEFVGHVSHEELCEYYATADVLVQTSRRTFDRIEGFGMPPIEGAFFGLPAVVSTCGGLPETVRDGETGLIVNEGDIAGTAGAVLRILGDKRLRRRMSQAALQWARKFDGKGRTDAYFSGYRESLAGKARGPA